MKTEQIEIGHGASDRTHVFSLPVILFSIATALLLAVFLVVKVKFDHLRAPATPEVRSHYAELIVCNSKSLMCQAEQKIYRELIAEVLIRQDLSHNQLGNAAAQARSKSLELAVQEIADKDSP